MDALVGNPTHFFVGESDRAQQRATVRVPDDIGYRLNQMGLIAGDFIHNVRSALDVLISTLLRLQGKPDASSNFPIVRVDNKDSRISTRKLLQGLVREQKAIIKGLQPYQRTYGSRFLLSLQALSNDEKHRILHPAKLLVTRLHIEIAPPAKIVERRYAKKIVLKPGAEVFSVRLNPYPKGEVEMQYHITTEIAFAEAPGYDAVARMGEFVHILDHATAIVERLALTLDPPHGVGPTFG